MNPRVAWGLVALILTAALSWVVSRPSIPNIPPPSHVQKGPLETEGDPNDILVFEDMRVRRWLVETIVRAAQVTGADPAYLMALADKESSLIPYKEARSSSAEGLFQFIDSTWLEVLRRYGPKHGYEREANAIRVVDGRPVVWDGKKRARILSLRRDPYPFRADGWRDDQHSRANPCRQGGAQSDLRRTLCGPSSGRKRREALCGVA